MLQTMLRCLLPFALAACSLLSPRLAAPPEDIVSGFEATFPTLRALEVSVYFRDEDCEYFVYRDGYYTSKPDDEFCQVFSDALHPDGDPPRPRRFTADARADLATVKAAFGAADVPLDYLNLSFTLDQANILGNSGNAFGYNGCYSFFYRTPQGEDSDPAGQTIINADWSMENFCL